MAVGDSANAAGYPLVPNIGEEGKLKYGAREINRTRDMVAEVKATVPVGKEAYRIASGITSGAGNPSGGSNGDLFFKVL